MKQSIKRIALGFLAVILPCLGWAEVTSLNIKLNAGTFGENTYYGCYPVKGSEWQVVGGETSVTDKALTGGETVSYTTSALWSMGYSGFAANILLDAYLDDGGTSTASGGTTITISGLDTTTYANYDVLIYMTADTTPSAEKHFLAPTVNGTQYTVGGAGDANWGNAGSYADAPVIGVNCLHVAGLTATAENSTLTISLPGIVQDNRGNGRACISAIQVIPTGAESISFYVGNSDYSGGVYGWDGAPVVGTAWNELTSSVVMPQNNKGERQVTASVTTNSKGGAWAHTAPHQLGNVSRSYYDGQWNLSLTGIPYSEYKVVLFMATDNQNLSWGSVKVTKGSTETYYAYDEDKNLITDGVTAETTWGVTATANGTEGVDVMVIPNLSGDISLLTHGQSKNQGDSTRRGGLFAMQIINTGEILSLASTATITDGINASTIAWDPSAPTSETDAVINVKANATVTMDAPITVKRLTTLGTGALKFTGTKTLSAETAVIATNTDISDITSEFESVTILSDKVLTVAQPFADTVTVTREENSTLKFTGDLTTLPLTNNAVTETSGNVVLEDGVTETLKGRAWTLSGGISSAPCLYFASGAEWGNPGNKSYLTMTNGAKLTITNDAATIDRTTTDGAVMFAECGNGSTISISGEGTEFIVPNGALNLSRDGATTATVSDKALLQAYKLGGTSNSSTLTVNDATLTLGKEGNTDGLVKMTSCKLILDNATLSAAGDWAVATDSTASQIEVNNVLTINPNGKTITLRNMTFKDSANLALVGAGTVIIPAGTEGTVAVPAEVNLRLVLNDEQMVKGYKSTVTSGAVTFVKDDGTVLTEDDGVNGNEFIATGIVWNGSANDNLWETDANWNGGVAPTTNDIVRFNLTEDIEITLPTIKDGTTIHTLSVKGATLTLNGGVLNATTAIIESALATPATCINIPEVSLDENAVLTLNHETTTNGNTADLTMAVTGGKIIKTGAGTLKFGQPTGKEENPIFDGTTVQINKGAIKLVIGDGDPWIKDTTFVFANGTALQQYGWIHASGTITLNAAEGVEASAFGTHLANATLLKKSGAGKVTIAVGNADYPIQVDGGTLAYNGGTISGKITTAQNTTFEITGNATLSNEANTFLGLLRILGGTTSHSGADRGINSLEIAEGATFESSRDDGLNYNSETTVTINGTMNLKARWTIFAGNKIYLNGTLASATENISNNTAYDFYNNASNDNTHSKLYVTGSNAKITGLWGAHDSSKTLDVIFNANDAKLTIESAPTDHQHIVTSRTEGITGGTIAVNTDVSTEKLIRVANGVALSGTGSWGGPVTFEDGAIVDATANAITVGGAITQSGTLTINVKDDAVANDTILSGGEGSSFKAENITIVDRDDVIAAVDGTSIKLVTVAVCKIGDTKYHTIQAAVDAAEAGDEIVLTKIADATTFIWLDEAVEVNKQVTIDLNGAIISMTEKDTAGNGVFWVTTGGNLTINGDGVIAAVACGEDENGNLVYGNNYHMAVWADGGKVTINGGTYNNLGARHTDGTTYNHFDLIYVKNGGEIVINGGHFVCETLKWTLNSHDTLTGTITVKGGTFVEYDPANIDTEPESSGRTSWVADGYYTYATEPTNEETGTTVTWYHVKEATVSNDITIEGDDSGKVLGDAAKAALKEIAAKHQTSITTVVVPTEEHSEALDDALTLFDNIVKIEDTTATIDWDFGITDIEVNRNTNGSLKGTVTIKAAVTQGDEDQSAARFVNGATLRLVDEETNEPFGDPVTINENTEGVASFNVYLDDLQEHKVFKVKIQKD